MKQNKDRNPDIFNAFCKENYNKIILRCRRGGFNQEDAEDITQNIFYQLWTKYDDDYITYNRGYIWKYLINFQIINFVISNERCEILKENYPVSRNEDINSLELIKFVKENLPEKERPFFSKLMRIGRAGMDKEFKRNTIWWQNYRKHIRDIIKKY